MKDIFLKIHTKLCYITKKRKYFSEIYLRKNINVVLQLFLLPLRYAFCCGRERNTDTRYG